MGHCGNCGKWGHRQRACGQAANAVGTEANEQGGCTGSTGDAHMLTYSADEN